MGSKKQKVQRQEAKTRDAAIDYDAIVSGHGGRSYITLNRLLKAAGARGGPFRAFYNGSMPEQFVAPMRAALERAGKPLTAGSANKASGDPSEQGERLRAAERPIDPAMLRKPSWMTQGVSVRVASAGRRQGKVGVYAGDLAEGYVNVDFGHGPLDRYAFYPGELARVEEANG